jgi:hypothetical protein
MIFPAARARLAASCALLGLAMLVAVSMGATATARADDGVGADDGPALHRVTYTVTADNPVYAEIYYRDTDPPNFADYSHDPYSFSPTAEADLGRPGQSWVYQAMLADPDQWAMVTAMSGDSAVTAPTFHCKLAVDGVVVVTKDGPKGALCSLRSW